MATSTIPAALDGILAGLRGAAALTGITIFDGQPTTDDDPDFIAIGFGDDISPAVSGKQEPAALGNLRRSETYDINCEVSSWLGDSVTKTVRDRAFTNLAAIENVIRNDGTLAAAVTFGDFGGNIQVLQVQTNQGAVCSIRFTLSVKITRI